MKLTGRAALATLAGLLATLTGPRAGRVGPGEAGNRFTGKIHKSQVEVGSPQEHYVKNDSRPAEGGWGRGDATGVGRPSCPPNSNRLHSKVHVAPSVPRRPIADSSNVILLTSNQLRPVLRWIARRDGSV